MTTLSSALIAPDELEALTAAVDRALPAFLADLEHLVNIDCGSYTKAGVDEVGRWIGERPARPAGRRR